jgi:hypothetical protein
MDMYKVDINTLSVGITLISNNCCDFWSMMPTSTNIGFNISREHFKFIEMMNYIWIIFHGFERKKIEEKTYVKFEEKNNHLKKN